MEIIATFGESPEGKGISENPHSRDRGIKGVETYALGFVILRTPKCQWSEGTIENSTRERIRFSVYRDSGVGEPS
jgi:hypothetical protein